MIADKSCCADIGVAAEVPLPLLDLPETVFDCEDDVLEEVPDPFVCEPVDPAFVEPEDEPELLCPGLLDPELPEPELDPEPELEPELVDPDDPPVEVPVEVFDVVLDVVPVLPPPTEPEEVPFADKLPAITTLLPNRLIPPVLPPVLETEPVALMLSAVADT